MPYVTVEPRGDVAVVRIDRPPANAMDLGLLAEGTHVLEELGRSEPAAVVLTGREGFFSAGVDLKVAPTLDADQQRDMVAGINGLFAGWYGFPRPVVCAVNGHAIAGGLILALCGDRRVGGEHGRLGLTELRAGVPYPGVAMAIVRAELSPAAARGLVLGAELTGMREGLALGVLDELADDPLERALDVAARLGESPAATYATVKHQLRGEALAAIADVLSEGGDPLGESWLGAETAGAAQSILEG